MPDLVARARAFASQAHRRIDRRRQLSHQTYEAHLKGVAALVSRATSDPEVQAAAWLHDLVQDTQLTLGDLRREFG